MSELELFNFDGREIRVIVVNGEPWWVADDVADALDYSRGRNMIRLLDEDMKGAHKMSTPGGHQDVSIVSRSGVYRLILRSLKPQAKRFERLVVDTILPTIAATGSYGTAPALPPTYAEALRELAATVEAAEQATARAVTAEAVAVEQAPKIEYLAGILVEQHVYSMNDTIKWLNSNYPRIAELDLGRTKLYEKLREWGWLIKGSTEPKQDQTCVPSGTGRLVLNEYEDFNRKTGKRFRTVSTAVTPKGRQDIAIRLMGELEAAETLWGTG